jgi:hypothetical protein
MDMTFKLDLAKETPGTYRYDNKDSDAAITSLYIKKGAFLTGEPPQSITVNVKS